MATNLIDVELQSPFQNQPIGATGLDLGETSIAKDPFKFGEKVAQIDVGRQFGQLLDKGQEGMIATANALISEGTFTAEELQGLDPNLPAFQSEKGQIAWYTGIKQKIDAKAKAKAEQERQELGVKAFSAEGTRDDRTKFGIQSGLKPGELFDQFTDEEKTVFTQDINEAFQSRLTEEGINEASSSQDVLDVIQGFVKDRPEVAELEAFKVLISSLEGGLDRASKERQAKEKRDFIKPGKLTAGERSAITMAPRIARDVTELQELLKQATVGELKGKIIKHLPTELRTKIEAARARMFGVLSRNIAAEKGVLTDKDIERISKALPGFEQSADAALFNLTALKEISQLNLENILRTANASNIDIGTLGEEFLSSPLFEDVGHQTDFGRSFLKSKKPDAPKDVKINLTSKSPDKDFIKTFKKKFEKDPTEEQIKIMRSNLKKRGR